MRWKRPWQQVPELVLQTDLWSHEEQLGPVGPDAGGLGGQQPTVRIVWTPGSAEARFPASSSRVESCFALKSREGFAVVHICHHKSNNLLIGICV